MFGCERCYSRLQCQSRAGLQPRRDGGIVPRDARYLGRKTSVGHSAIVHACTVGDEVLVGMGAVILDGAVIGRQSIIGAKALVTQGAKIPPGSLVLGAPAKVVRRLTPKERAGIKYWAVKYVH